DRLLAALRGGTPTAAGPSVAPAELQPRVEMDASATSQEQTEAAHAPSERVPLWQSWLAPAALGTGASGGLGAGFFFRPVDGALTVDEILASGWLAAVDETALEQTPIEKQAPPRRFPAPRSLAVQPIAWRAIKGLLGRPRGVAYQLRSAAARATLYVIDEDA